MLNLEWNKSSWVRKFGESWAWINDHWRFIGAFHEENENLQYSCYDPTNPTLSMANDNPTYKQIPSGIYLSTLTNKPVVVKITKKITKSFKIGIHPEIYNIHIFKDSLETYRPINMFTIEAQGELLNNLKRPAIKKELIRTANFFMIDTRWVLHKNHLFYLNQEVPIKTQTHLPYHVKTGLKEYASITKQSLSDLSQL